MSAAPIVLDGRCLQDGSAVRGIGTYLRGLLEGYATLGVTGRLGLLLQAGRPLPGEVARYGMSDAGRIPVLKRRAQPVADPFLVAWRLHRSTAALYHAVDYAQPVTTSLPVVVTTHDLVPFLFPRQYPWMRRERLLGLRLLRRADAIIANSRDTAESVTRVAGVDPARITVTPLAPSAAYRPPADAEVEAARAALGIDGEYVVAAGYFGDPRKRLRTLLDIIGEVRREHPVTLVLTGDQGRHAGIVAAAVSARRLDRATRLTGHLPVEQLRALYGGATCLLVTSSHEGFGLPVLEAMACGSPVASFANSALMETGGEAAITVADGDASALAGVVLSLLGDAGMRRARRDLGVSWAAGFSWERTARATFAVYERLLGEGPAT